MKFTKRELPKHEGTGSSSFLKVNDGQSVTGVFRGEVFEFYQSWPKGGEKQIFARPTPGASARFKLNFVMQDPETQKLTAKVWEFGLTVYNMLAEISEAYPLEQTKIKITRRGVEKATQWMIIPLGPLDKKGLANIAAVPLEILNGQAAAPQETAPAEEDSSGLPF